jgi:hypothetical protein
MNMDSTSTLAEALKQTNAKEDVTGGTKNLKNSDTIDHARTRRDKGRTHVTRYGLLSRDIVRALVRSGESLRTLRRHEKKFRSVFRPRGTLGELFFDRWWSCHLRLHLLARLESNVLTSDHPHPRPPILSELREGKLPTLISASNENELEIAQNVDADLSRDLLRELALAQRYDAHYAREANRMLGLLLVMHKGGMAALEKLIVDGFEFAKIQKVEK